MKVILLQELKGRGGEGDVVEVADGFANNYLLKQGIALKATKGNLKQLEGRKHNIAKREVNRVSQAEATKEVLSSASIKITAQVGAEGQLFGSVTSQMIAQACKDQLGIEIDKRRVELKKPIKTAGEHEVEISIYRDIKGSVKVLVGSDGTVPEAEAETAKATEDVAAETDAAATDEVTNAAAEDSAALDAVDSAEGAEVATDEVETKAVDAAADAAEASE